MIAPWCAAAVLGPLVTQLVVVTAVWSRGGVWRYFPEAYRRPGSPGATLPKTDIGWTGAVAVIALFFLLEHFVGRGITG